MSKIEPDDILRHVEELGQVQPRPEATARAVQRVRRALEADQRANRSRRMRGKIMKIAIPSGIAAAVLLAVGLWLTVQTSQPVSAAEQLKEVVKVNTAYKGWIHVVAKPQLSSTVPSALKIRLPSLAHEHINTIDGTSVKVKEFKDERLIDFFSPPRKERITYSSKTGEIRIGSMSDEMCKAMAKSASTSPSVSQYLAMLKKETGRDPYEVKRTRDGRTERYDIVPFKDAAEAKKCRAENSSFMSYSNLTVWVDPKSKLIQKLRIEQEGIIVVASFTYGEPVIKDIYSLGVPRDAKVIDSRLAQQVKVILDRLDGRAVKGFGDCVGVITVTGVLPDGRLDAKERVGFLHVYATNGDKWLANNYRIGKPRSKRGWPASAFALAAPPKGWPRPDVKSLLRQIRHAATTRYVIINGSQGWMGWSNPRSPPFARLIHPKEKTVRIADEGLGGVIWPNNYRNGWQNPGVKVKAISDKTRGRRLIGLHVERAEQIDQGMGRRETILWLDPTRDDMPVEKTRRIYDGKGKTVTTEVRTQYLEFARLPNGQWYPTRWREERSQAPRNKKDGKPRISVQEYNLQIVPGMKLDDEWFTNPAERLETRKAQ